MPRKVKENEKQQYIKNINEIVEAGADKFSNLKKFYGVNGQLNPQYSTDNPNNKEFVDKYNNIKIDEPVKLTENQALAICMGNILEPELFTDENLNENTKKLAEDNPMSVYDVHTAMVIEDANRDVRRTKNYLPGFVKAREKSKTGIAHYETRGGTSGIDRPKKIMFQFAMDSLMTYTGSSMQSTTKDSAFSNKKMTMLLAKELYDAKLIQLQGNDSFNYATSLPKLESLSKEVQAAENAAKIKKQLLEGNIPAGSDQRKQLAEDLIFNSMLAELSRAEEYPLAKNCQKLLDQYYIKMGINRNDKDPDSAISEINRDIKNVNIEGFAEIGLKNAYRKYTVSDLKAILAQKNGLETLKALYSESIKQTEEYNQLVNAASEEDLIGAMMDADELAEDSFYKFPNVKVPTAAKTINDKLKKTLETEVKNIITTCEQKNYKLLQERDDDYCIKAFDSANMSKNYTAINSIGLVSQSHITANTEGDEYKKYMESLGKLHSFAESLDTPDSIMTYEKFQKYKELLLDAVRKLQSYIDSLPPAVPQSPEAQSLKTAGQMKRVLNANLISFDNTYNSLYNEKVPAPETQKEKFLEANRLDQQEQAKIRPIDQKKENDPFRQGKHKDTDFKNICHNFTAYRTAVHTLATLALAAETKNGKNYTFDQIFDHSQLIQEKSAAFDKVVDALSRQNPDDKKFLAKVMVDGEHAMQQIIDEKAATMDFSDPNITQTEDYRKMMQAFHVQFDAWQELMHVPDEVLAEAKNYNKSLQDFEGAKAYIGTLYLAGSSMSEVYGYKTAGFNTYSKGVDADLGKTLDSSIGEKIIFKYIQDGLKGGKKLSELNDTTDLTNISNFMKSVLPSLNREIRQINNSWAVKDLLMAKLQDGSLLKDVNIQLDLTNPDLFKKVIITGVPTMADVQAELDLLNMPEQIRKNSLAEKLNHLNNLKAEVAPENQFIIDNAADAYYKLDELISKNTLLTGENKQLAQECMINIMKAEMVKSFEKTGLKGNGIDAAIEKTIKDMKLTSSMEDYIGLGSIGKFAYTNHAAEAVKAKQAAIDNIVSENLFKTDYAAKEKEANRRDTIVRESIIGSVTESIHSVHTIFDRVGGISVNDELYSELTDNSEESLSQVAFGDSLEHRLQDEPQVESFVENAKNVIPIIDRKKYKEYVEKTNTYVSDLEGIIENELKEGRMSDKEADYIRAAGMNTIKRNLRGFGMQYMQLRTPLVEGMRLINASTVAEIKEGLRDKIDKYNDKFPVYDIAIEGDKQLDTLADYWSEKERGVLTPDRENIYRNQLYAQTQNLLALCNKLNNVAMNPETNAEIFAAKVFKNNEPFEASRFSNRGIGPYEESLKAYKAGLENGWAIDDLGALASFNIAVKELNDKVNHNEALTLDELQIYDKPRYHNPRHKDFMDKINKFQQKLMTTPLKDAQMRKKALDGMQSLLDEAHKNGYLTSRQPNAYKQVKNFAERNSREIELGKTPAVHSKVNPEVFTKNAVKTDIVYRNAQLNSIVNKFNTTRTDGYWSKESPAHKELRESAEALQSVVRKRHALENAGEEITNDQRLDFAAEYIGKLDEVIYNSKNYQKDRAGASSRGGKERLEGAKQLEDFAKNQRNEMLKYLKEKGIVVKDTTIKQFREIYSAKKSMDAFNKLEEMNDFPANEQGKAALMDNIADIMVYKFATSNIEANKNAFYRLGQSGLKNQIKKDKDFKTLVETYLKNPEMTPKKMSQELMTGEALNKMRNLNKKYVDMEKERAAESTKKQQEIQKRNGLQM